MNAMAGSTTRLAPSPTGALHLGNARTFILTAWWAASIGADVVLRIEDLDHPRKKPGAIESLREDLRWMRVDWMRETPIQSSRSLSHTRALLHLLESGFVYACRCSRRDVVDAQSAPHDTPLDLVYPGTCAGLDIDPIAESARLGKPLALRFRVPDVDVAIDDLVQGPRNFRLSSESGDFVVARVTPDGRFEPGYQLAVVLDDAEDGVTHVLRGADLLLSAARQRVVQAALDLPPVVYGHFPLVVGDDGRRLAKRHGDTRIATLRERGMTAERLWNWTAASIRLPADTIDGHRSRRLNFETFPRVPVVATTLDIERELLGP